MSSPGLAGTLAAFEIRIFIDHVLPKLVLPPGQLLFVADDILCGKPLVGSQRDKTKVHMGCFLVHMHNCGYDCFGGLMLFHKF